MGRSAPFRIFGPSIRKDAGTEAAYAEDVTWPEELPPEALSGAEYPGPANCGSATGGLM